MENRTKELRSINNVSAQAAMDDLARALSGVGPALAFGPSTSHEVPASIAIVVATSGSTGAAKEVALSSRAIIASAKSSNDFLGARFGDTWSLLLPLTHIAGVNVLARSLGLGTAAIDLRIAVEFPKADFTAIVPTQLFRALNGDQLLLNHLRDCKAVLVGGAALTDELHSQAKDAGINIVTTYGMTETCGGCVYNGIPLDGVDVEIRDGYIAIKGAVLATTYLNNEIEWLESLQDGWFLTKDLGSFDSGILSVRGRSDEIFISGGEKISLFAVEAAIRKDHPAAAFAAFTLDDAEWGSALHIALAQNSDISQEEISDSLTRALGHVAKPKGFLIIAEFPYTPIGKVDRRALIELATAQRGLK